MGVLTIKSYKTGLSPQHSIKVGNGKYEIAANRNNHRNYLSKSVLKASAVTDRVTDPISKDKFDINNLLNTLDMNLNQFSRKTNIENYG